MIAAPEPGHGRRDDRDAGRALFRATLIAWLVILAVSWIGGGPLGHDEAAYAIGGTARLHGEASPWLYRSEGMHLLAMPGLLLGGSELWLRAPAVLFAIGFVFAMRRAGDRLGPGRGAWAAAIAVGMHGLSMRGHELLSDLPSTTCILMAIAILVEELERDDGARWRVVLAAPWLAAAFYLRYASCVPIALVGVASLVWWRAIVRRPLPIVATAAVLALLLAPHAAQAIAITGDPLGIIRFSSDVPYHLYVGDGLVTYLTFDPFVHYGVVAAPVLLAGVVSVARPSRAARRAAIALWLIAIAQIVVLGLRSHAMVRYIYVALCLLVILGVDGIMRLAPWNRRARAIALVLVALSWLGVAAASAYLSLRPRDWRTPIVEAAAIIERDAAGRPCHVVSRRFTQLMWYAGCPSGTMYPLPADLERWPLVYGVWLGDRYSASPPDTFQLGNGARLRGVDLHTEGFQVMRFTR